MPKRRFFFFSIEPTFIESDEWVLGKHCNQVWNGVYPRFTLRQKIILDRILFQSHTEKGHDENLVSGPTRHFINHAKNFGSCVKLTFTPWNHFFLRIFFINPFLASILLVLRVVVVLTLWTGVLLVPLVLLLLPRLFLLDAPAGGGDLVVPRQQQHKKKEEELEEILVLLLLVGDLHSSITVVIVVVMVNDNGVMI